MGGYGGSQGSISHHKYKCIGNSSLKTHITSILPHYTYFTHFTHLMNQLAATWAQGPWAWAHGPMGPGPGQMVEICPLAQAKNWRQCQEWALVSSPRDPAPIFCLGQGADLHHLPRARAHGSMGPGPWALGPCGC